MIRTKKLLIAMLITAFMAAVMFLATNTGNSYASQDVIRPHNPAQALKLTTGFSDEKLQVSTTPNAGYTYQYWIKTKVVTDNSANLANEQYIWQLAREFDSTATAQITVTENEIDQNGKYNVIVRVKDGATLVDEIYGSYSAAGISEVKVNGKAVQGDMIISGSSTVNVEIISNSDNVVNYALYYGDDEITDFSHETGEFTVPMSYFGTGYNIFRAEIETSDGQKDTQYFKVYVYDEYVAEERPVISSLSGDTDWENDGLTTFTMNVQYADGTPIPFADATNYNFDLISGGIYGSADIIDTLDGTFEVQFTVDYNGKNGIYRTVGTVSRDGINGEDDKIIRYYDGYARSATLEQSAKDSEENDLALSDYTIAAGQSITITATGTIPEASEDLEYGFYREDASGWVLIKEYSTSNTFTWTPTRAGTYNIQARIKEAGAGSYEKTASVIYTISDVTLTGTLDVNIYDYETNSEATVFEAGRPYKLEAAYDGAEDMLYMFTLSSKNLGTVYLNKFNPSPYYMFIPPRPDSYIITARAISSGSFGFKDVSLSKTITVDFEKDISAPENLTFAGSTIIWDEVSKASGYTVKVEGNSASTEYDVTANSFDLGDKVTGGSYIVSVRTKSVYNVYSDFGTPLNITAIDSEAGLKAINNAPAANYILISDIELRELKDQVNTYYNFIPTEFTGVLDGNGKNIDIIEILGAWDRGLFKDVSGTIRNVTVDIGTYVSSTQGGAFIGKVLAGGKVQNVHLNIGEIKWIGNNYAGTIASVNGGIIENCVVTAHWSNESSGTPSLFQQIAKQYYAGGWTYLNNTVIINNAPELGSNGMGWNGNKTIPSAVNDIIINIGGTADITGITADSSFTLSYISSDTDIATVDGGGVVTAVAEGTAYIDIILNGITAAEKNAAIRINIKVLGDVLAPPAGITFSGSLIQWQAVEQAAGYKIELQNGSDTPTVFDDITDTFCDISSVYIGSGEKTYTIKVWSVNSSGELSEQSSDIEYSVTLLSDWVGLHNLMKNEQPAGAVLSKHYVLTADIDCGGFGNKSNNVSDLWMTSGQSTFKGVFDGNGYKIYNFNVGSAWNTGLFRTVEGTVKNLTMHCGTYSQSIQGGILAYQITNGGLVENVYINVDRIDNKGTYANNVGGFNGALANTYNIAPSWGIIAFEAKNGGTIKDCVASGNFDNTSALALKDLGAVNADIDGANFKGFAAGGTQTGNTLIININKGGSSSLGGTVAGVTSIFVDFSEITVAAGSTTAEFDYSISDKQLSFATEDSAIATVSANDSLATVTGVSVGSTHLSILISGINANGQQAFIKIPLTVN